MSDIGSGLVQTHEDTQKAHFGERIPIKLRNVCQIDL